jgi:cysteinyl-tRNA synthetase
MIDTIFPKHYIDIHGGCYDLKFPDHENEIAQSEATHGNKIAHYWMHNAFINFGNEKMSKSLGNVVYAKDMIKEYGGPVTRLVILNAHYRQPVNFTEETVKEAQQVILRMQMAYKQAALKLQSNNIDLSKGQPLFINNFLLALADDLNTANALKEVYDLLKEINQQIRSRDTDYELLNNQFKTLTDMFYVLGLDINFVKFDEEISSLYKEYLLSKENKDFAKSDEIRKVLIEKGVM